MLLSRVADALYWISRYLERAEHTARLIDVAGDLGLDRAAAVQSRAIDRLYGSIGLPTDGDGDHSLVARALFDTSRRNSVAACVLAARENARQVREEISSDMWEQLNDLFLLLCYMEVVGLPNPATLYLLDVYPYLLDQFHLWHKRMGMDRSPLGNLPCC